jgi:hypothetical protein
MDSLTSPLGNCLYTSLNFFDVWNQANNLHSFLELRIFAVEVAPIRNDQSLHIVDRPADTLA